MNNQLEKDLANKLDARLRQACMDYIALCEIAGINVKDGGALFTEGMARVTDMTPEEFGKAMAEALRKCRAKRAAA